MYRQEVLDELALILSGYDKQAWEMLSHRTKATYQRAAFSLMSRWEDIYTTLLKLPEYDHLRPLTPEPK